MIAKNFKKLMLFAGSLFVFCFIFLNGHIELNKITYNLNIAKADSWSLVNTYGVTNSSSNDYSIYMSNLYDYEFRATWSYGSVGNASKIYVYDQATPYALFKLSYEYGRYGYNTSTGVIQPSTSGYYNCTITQLQVNLYKKLRVNPYVQYGNVLTPQAGYPNSIYAVSKVSNGEDSHGRDVYKYCTTGVSNINLGTVKYDQLSSTFSVILNFTGEVSEYDYINYIYTFYVVDESGIRTQIFRQQYAQNYSNYPHPIGGSRAISISGINVPVKMEVTLESQTPSTIVIPFADSLPPSIPILSTSSVEYTNKPIIITAYSTDQSGVAGYQYSLDNSSWDAIGGDKYTNTLEGSRTIYCRAVDNYGNVSASSNIWSGYDITSPIIGTSIVQNRSSTGYDLYMYNVSDPLNSSNSSQGSGINRVQIPTWTENKGKDDIQINWSTGSSASANNLGSGTWYYRVNIKDHNNELGPYDSQIYVYDNAGNCVISTPNIYPIFLILPPNLKVINPENNAIYSN